MGDWMGDGVGMLESRWGYVTFNHFGPPSNKWRYSVSDVSDGPYAHTLPIPRLLACFAKKPKRNSQPSLEKLSFTPDFLHALCSRHY